MRGVDLVTVKELLGHKTLDMTLRYSHLAPAHKVGAVDRLAGSLAAAPEEAEASMTSGRDAGRTGGP